MMAAPCFPVAAERPISTPRSVLNVAMNRSREARIVAVSTVAAYRAQVGDGVIPTEYAALQGVAVDVSDLWDITDCNPFLVTTGTQISAALEETGNLRFR
jgi:hypothetical protein